MGEGQHKIKRKAEQMACMEAINFIKLHNDISVNVNESNVISANNYDNDDSE
jgi:hypothetical protein